MTSMSNIWKQLTSILSNLNNFPSFEVVDRVSETQLQVGENLAVKGLGVNHQSCIYFFFYLFAMKVLNKIMSEQRNFNSINTFISYY